MKSSSKLKIQNSVESLLALANLSIHGEASNSEPQIFGSGVKMKPPLIPDFLKNKNRNFNAIFLKFKGKSVKMLNFASLG